MIGRLMTLIGSMAFLWITGVMGCSETSLPVPVAPAPTPTNSPAQYWQEAINSLRFSRTVSFHLTHEVGGTDIGSGIVIADAWGKVEFPDRFSLEATGSLPGLKIILDIAIIRQGDQVFFRDPLSGAWREVDLGILPFRFGSLNETIPDALKLSKNIKFTSIEKVQGVTMYSLVAEANSSTFRGLIPNVIDNGSIIIEIDIDTQNYRIKVIRLKGRLIESDSNDVIRVLEFYDFVNT